MAIDSNARQTLEEAKLMLEAGHVNACVNRVCYACFYAVSALLLTRNISTSVHSYVCSLLHRDYIRPRQVSKEMGDHYGLLFDSRQKGDYEDLVVFDANDGSGQFGPQQVISTAAVGPCCVYAADLDRDGDLDVLSASYGDGKIAWYENE